MRIQRPVKNRKQISSAVLYQIRNKVETLAERFDCSKSFVINTILAESLNIYIEEKYNDYPKAARNSKRSA